MNNSSKLLKSNYLARSKATRGKATRGKATRSNAAYTSPFKVERSMISSNYINSLTYFCADRLGDFCFCCFCGLWAVGYELWAMDFVCILYFGCVFQPCSIPLSFIRSGLRMHTTVCQCASVPVLSSVYQRSATDEVSLRRV
jgi:hypothetical protein